MGYKIAADNVDFVREIATNKKGEVICEEENCCKPIKGKAYGQFGTYHKECYYGKK